MSVIRFEVKDFENIKTSMEQYDNHFYKNGSIFEYVLDKHKLKNIEEFVNYLDYANLLAYNNRYGEKNKSDVIKYYGGLAYNKKSLLSELQSIRYNIIEADYDDIEDILNDVIRVIAEDIIDDMEGY